MACGAVVWGQGVPRGAAGEGQPARTMAERSPAVSAPAGGGSFFAGLTAISLTNTAPPSPLPRPAASAAKAAAAPAGGPDEIAGLMGLDAQYRRAIGGSLAGLVEFSFTPQVTVGPCGVVGMVLGFGPCQLRPGSSADSMLTQPAFGEIGLFGKQYFCAAGRLVRPYFLAGLSWARLAWDYKTPMPTEWGPVEMDRVDGVDLYSGLGLSATFRRRWEFFGEISGGGLGLPSTTTMGLVSPFSSFAYVGAKAGFSLEF
ncbi:MAG: hypothetical protein U1F98_09440 [Verrucomicrobiota bacterium]